MTVDDGHDSAWEYHQNNVAKRARYPSKEHLKDAIVNWAMQTNREFKTTVSSPRFLTVECMDMNCPGRVHGYVPKWRETWIVSDVANHTCQLPCLPKDHRNLRSPLLARLLYSELVQMQAMRVKSIQIKVKTRFKYDISYGKAWRTRNKALEMRFGTFYDGYDCVVRLLETLKERNPGSYLNIQD